MMVYYKCLEYRYTNTLNPDNLKYIANSVILKNNGFFVPAKDAGCPSKKGRL